MVNAYVSWPSAPLKNTLVLKALDHISKTTPITFISQEERPKTQNPVLQWCTYDDMDHELAHVQRDTVLSSSYTFRKALIRKHYLSRIIHSYLKKRPDSILREACPTTFEMEISFADELDEMWADELYEVGQKLDSGDSWWILKPGMADRGMGLRIFHTKDNLQRIFESFEEDSEDEDDQENEDETAVVTSQLRHFVIQEYIMTPLLIDPSECFNRIQAQDELVGRKFHLRVYCVSSGDLQLYLYERVLALFSSAPYAQLSSEGGIEDPLQIDLRPHLTNTSLQSEYGETNVRLVDELEGCHILSGNGNKKLQKSDITFLMAQIKDILVETFRAALQNPVHFQALPNAFELYGVDFLVSHVSSDTVHPFSVKILEINAEPAIELTGPRLTWVLEDLFVSTAEVCVAPFFNDKKDPESWNIGEVRHNFVKCMDESVRGPGT